MLFWASCLAEADRFCRQSLDSMPKVIGCCHPESLSVLWRAILCRLVTWALWIRRAMFETGFVLFPCVEQDVKRYLLFVSVVLVVPLLPCGECISWSDCPGTGVYDTWYSLQSKAFSVIVFLLFSSCTEVLCKVICIGNIYQASERL